MRSTTNQTGDDKNIILRLVVLVFLAIPAQEIIFFIGLSLMSGMYLFWHDFLALAGASIAVDELILGVFLNFGTRA